MEFIFTDRCTTVSSLTKQSEKGEQRALFDKVLAHLRNRKEVQKLECCFLHDRALRRYFVRGLGSIPLC